MPLVRSVTTWLRLLSVSVVMSGQVASLSLVYSHLVSAPVPPVSVAARVSLPLPAPAVAVGVPGLAGLVRNVRAASSVEQSLLLYAL